MPELPPLGKFVIISYEQDELDFPVVGVAVDPRAPGYAVPTVGTACPETVRFPNHKFLTVRPTNVDNRAMWIYSLETGPAIVSTMVDPESGALITKTKTRKLTTAITEGTSVVAASGGVGVHVKIIEAEGIDETYSMEVVTRLFEPTANALNVALESVRTMGFQFPARIDIATLDLCGTAIGYKRPTARLITATIKTYWVVSSTKPSLSIENIIPNTIWINDVKYEDVLHDQTTRFYICGPVTFTETTPSYTEYTTGWVGQQKLIAGEVTPTKYTYYWKVEATFLTMR